MKQYFRLYSLILFLVCFTPVFCFAQTDSAAIQYADQYLDSRTAALDKYLDRSEGIQQRLLQKLRRKEARMLRKLAAKDSTLYRQYVVEQIAYDSIATLARDTAALARMKQNSGRLIDSLKAIQQFIGKQSGKLDEASALAGKAGANLPYTDEISKIQARLNAQQGLDQLMQQRSKALESLAGQANIGGLQSIQKDLYYAREKIKNWKSLADDPDAAEEKAMEYLQGTEGFQEMLNPHRNAYGGLGPNATAADLQRMGYQTKSQVNNMLQQKLGNNLGAVQQQMADQVQQYSDKLHDVTGKVQEAKQTVNEAKQTLAEAKATKDQLKQIEKPAFRKNPERGKPFWQRFEVQYNFQTNRAGTDGLKPAMLELGASAAFKHSPRLSYGAGLALSTGLGQNWQNIRFSYEGISTRVYADWKAIYGFSLQAGYERTFRPANRAYLPEQSSNPSQPGNADDDNFFKESFGGQQQAAYLGIMKRYRINSKWSGTFLLGYNFLWQEEGMRSPILLRFGWGK